MPTKRRRAFALAIVSLLTTALAVFGLEAPAQASAQTCISAPGGWVCTNVDGSGTWVNSVGVSRGGVSLSSGAPIAICNYSAWFFYVPPSGGAYSLGTQSRWGCGLGRVWLTQSVGRNFYRGTQMCAKFYENDWGNFIGQKCVGIS